jgi:hypothetical protein
MKTTINLEESSIWTSFKSAFYALQVIIIALAIPLLSYMEMSYDTKPTPEQSTVKNTNRVEFKQNLTTFNR